MKFQTFPRRLLTLLLVLCLGASMVPPPPASAQEPTPASAEKGSVRAAEFVPGEVLVRFRPGAEASELAVGDSEPLSVAVPDAEGLGGGSLSIRIENMQGLQIVEGLRLARVNPKDTLRAVAALNARPDVEYAEPNFIQYADATPNDPFFPQMYGLHNTGQSVPGGAGVADADIDAPEAWDLTTGSPTVVIGVIDTGIDINHPDLAPNIWTNPVDSTVNGVDEDGNGRTDDTNGWDFNGDCNPVCPNRTVYDGLPTDDLSTTDVNETEIDAHGTHVAGTIGAVGNNGVGVTGINWQVKIMPLKFLGKTGSGPTSAAIAAMDYAVDMKNRGVNIRAINNSWGGAAAVPQSITDAITRLNNVGILFVAAAGNDGTDDDDFPHSPAVANVPNVIAVARSNQFDNRSLTSNFGLRTVHVGAPGFSILSTTPNNTYSRFSGTSMSSPHVTGVAGLILARHPGISTARLKAALVYSGDAFNNSADVFSRRRLNARSALVNSDETDNAAPSSSSPTALVNGRTVTLQFNAGDDGISGTPAVIAARFAAPNGQNYHLGSFIPTGSTHSITVLVPFRHTSGNIVLRVIDNAGNEATPTFTPVNISADAADPYVVTTGPGGGLSTGGTSMNFNIAPNSSSADDAYIRDFPIGFTFPFFGRNKTTVNVSSNGALYFSAPPFGENINDAADPVGNITDLNLQEMIAAMWQDNDLRNCFRSDGDVFVVRPSAGRVIFRWQGVTFSAPNCSPSPSGSPVNFEAELRSDGTIITRYGDGNVGVRPVVGISNGQADTSTGGATDAYLVNSHSVSRLTRTSTAPPAINLTNAASVTFAPRGTTTNVPGTLQFGSASFNVNEFAGVAQVTVTRTVGSDGTVSVSFATSNGTAAAGSDYVATSGTLTFAAGETTKTFNVPIVNDAVLEDLETINLTLSNPTGGASLGAQSTAVVNIVNDDAAPAFVISDVTQAEGNSGTTNFNFIVSKVGQTAFSASVVFSTDNGTAANGSDYAATSGTLTFAPAETQKTIPVQVNGDSALEADETFFVNLQSAANASIADSQGLGTITNDDASVPAGTVQFGAAAQSVGEAGLSATVTVTRTDTAGAASVDYATGGGTADGKKDYTLALGRLDFAPGEASKTITVLVTDDVFAEGSETLNVTLSNAAGMSLGTPSTATITITDNDAVTGANPVQAPSFNANFFVRQQYLDFFSREPDAPGLAHWTGVVSGCAPTEPCGEVLRINVSGAFFLSIEFEQTGYLITRTYKAAFGDGVGSSTLGGTPHLLTVPIIRHNEFLFDAQRIGRGVIVNQGNWEAQLEANKQAYFLEFVQRAQFTSEFPSALTPTQYVDRLNGRAGSPLDATERQNLINELTANNTPSGRASVLRKVAEDPTLFAAERNRAFVLMQYFGYLRRDPNSGPDIDYTGYDFWLGNLNAFNGNFVQAELVKAFISSAEYQARFGPTN